MWPFAMLLILAGVAYLIYEGHKHDLENFDLQAEIEKDLMEAENIKLRKKSEKLKRRNEECLKS